MLLLAGCVQQQTVCNKPYLRVGNACCLDKDDNLICDIDEAPKEQVPSRASGMVVLSHEIEGKDISAKELTIEKDDAVKEDTHPATTEPAAPVNSLRIVYINSSPALPERVLIDGSDIGPGINGVFSLGGVAQGEHKLEMYLDAVNYRENFSYSSGDVIIKFDPMVKVKGVVLSKGGAFLSDVEVYCDDVPAGRTDVSGSFEFSVKRGNHTIRLQGPGIYEKDPYEFMQAYNSLTFNLARKYSMLVSVTDSASGDPVSEARIYLDDQTQNKTSGDGGISIPGVAEGTHVIEASFGGISAKRNVLVAKEGQTFEISLKIPKNITLRVADKVSNDPVFGAQVSVDGEVIGLSALDGTLLLDSFYSGKHVVEISYLNVSTSFNTDLSSVGDAFTTEIDTPRDILLEIKDSKTGRSVSGWDIFLGNAKLTRSGTRTDADGKTQVKNLVPGSYDLSLHFPARDINASYAGVLDMAADTVLSVNIDMPDPRYSGAIICTEYGVYNKMGRCNVSVENVEYDRSMPSSDLDLFLFVFTESNASAGDQFKLAGQHLKGLSAISPGSVVSTVFDPLAEFEGDKKEVIVAVILSNWEYSSQNEESVGLAAVSAPDLSGFVQRIKEHCMDGSAECPQVLEKKIVGSLAYVN
jgi:hypothetical protein